MPKKFRGTALIRVDRKQAKIVNVDDIDDVTINSLRQHMGYHVTYSSTELDNEGQPRRVLRRKIKTKFDYIRGTFPTGMVDRCRKELKRKRYKVKVLDRRPTIPLDEKAILGAIDTFPMHLRPYQIDAITTGLYNPQMIFHVCTGGGKTVLFDVISQMTSLKTLVIVDREDLLQQHYRSLKKTRPGEDIGLIRGKQLDFGERVCIATVQTIMSRLKRSRYRMDKYLKSVEYVILDECLTLDTNIILEDGGVKKIKDITNEDEVVGGTVSNFFKRKSEIYKIKSSYSHLKTSPTHKNIVLERKRKINIIEVETCNLDKRKHSLLVPYKIPHTVKNNLSVDKAAFIALIATDGSLGVSGNYGRVKIIYSKESKKFIDDIFIKGVKSFGYIDNEIKTYTDKKRKSKLIWTLSKDLLMDLNRLGVPSGKKGNIIKIPDEIFYAPIKTIKKFIQPSWR